MCMHVDDHHVVHFSRYYIFCVVVREALQLLKVPHILIWQQEPEARRKSNGTTFHAGASCKLAKEMFYNSAKVTFIVHANSS